MTQKRSRVSNACRRCRQQKLKCDVHRPCTLCLHAEVQCVQLVPDIWKTSSQQEELTPAKRACRSGTRSSNDHRNGHVVQPYQPPSDAEASQTEGCSYGNATQPESTAVNDENLQISSSTAALVKEAFARHGARAIQNIGLPGIPGIGLRQTAARNKLFRSAIARMESLLPAPGSANIIVDTYFDRIHWFILLFFQDDFRSSFDALYSSSITQSEADKFGMLSRFLAVCALGLQYMGSHREGLLKTHGIDCAGLKDQILEALRQNLLEILALGTLEAVQTCVLLGTFYLYHGEPDLAWPICGCALRLAQASNLHRELQSSSKDVDLAEPRYRLIESRKRCWWAIYEIESFCSMLYGFPLSISDDDCSIGYLDSYNAGTSLESGLNLLSFKFYMSKLSKIVKSTLTRLYRMQMQVGSALTKKTGPSGKVRQIREQVNALDCELSTWRRDLPHTFWTRNHMSFSLDTNLDKDEDAIIGASGVQFEKHIFGLQSLILRLAYENARILIHRPLLLSKSPSESAKTCNAYEFNLSVKQCHDAALEISRLGELPIFQKACKTYAAAFVSMHLLTAAITLCIVINRNPLSADTPNTKLGIQRLLRMQSCLREHSVVAEQSFEVLRRLLALVMENELNLLVGEDPDTAKNIRLNSSGSQLNQTMMKYNLTRPPAVADFEQQATEYIDNNSTLEQPDAVVAPMEKVINIDSASLEDPVATQHPGFLMDVTGGSPDDHPNEYFDSIFKQYDFLNDNTFLDQQQAWMWAIDFGPGNN